MRKIKIVNSVSSYHGSYLSVLLRCKLMVTPLHECHQCLNTALKDGMQLYQGGHHLAIISRSGRRLLMVTER